MNYAVDQINEDHVLLEDVNSGEKIEVNLNMLPKNIKEGNIVTLNNGVYSLDNYQEELRRNRIAEKLERLKKLKNKE